MAQGVVKDATFQLVDSRTGAEYASTRDIPPHAQPGLQSRYTDWRYWNGVLNIAMLRLGEELSEPSYAQFSRNNVRFAFDNYRYFEERYKDEGNGTTRSVSDSSRKSWMIAVRWGKRD